MVATNGRTKEKKREIVAYFVDYIYYLLHM